MTDRFLPTDELLSALEDRDYDRPPALVANAHITGLGVARALSAHDVPVIALDRDENGVAPGSDAVDLAGRVTYPLSDFEGFRSDVEAIVSRLDRDPVAFGCMDEWVLGFARASLDRLRLPFADFETVDAVLDKESLYGLADRLGVPYPETYRLRETVADGGQVSARGPEFRTADEAAAELGFPLVVKPALKREFEEAIGTNVVEVGTREAYDDLVERAREADIRVMAQEKVPTVRGRDHSLASYVPPAGDPLSVVGRATVRHPLDYGTSCVVDVVERPVIEERALSVIEAAGYHGISEAEFVYDGDREEFVLLDVNTRPWKWIDLPVSAGKNLPYAAYADAVRGDAPGESDAFDGAGTDGPVADGAASTGADRWVYLRDYLATLAEHPSFDDVLTDAEWRSLVSGRFEGEGTITTGVYRPSDPGPTVDLLETEFSGREYYCAC